MPSFDPGVLYGLAAGLLTAGVLYVAGNRTTLAFAAGIVVGLTIGLGILFYHADEK